ncbi:peptidoglycan recognition protein family protein [bacterium]|nr:peptidoglycan recognition protein family protein [bacterium]
MWRTIHPDLCTPEAAAVFLLFPLFILTIFPMPVSTLPKPFTPALSALSQDSQLSTPLQRITQNSPLRTRDAELGTTSCLVVVKPGKPLKTVLRRAAIVTNVADTAPPRPGMTLKAFLQQRLGKRYHTRSEWAGRTRNYLPKLTRWRVWRPIGRVEYVTIHNADGVPDEHPAAMIRNIFRGHTDRHDRLNAPDVGYHFFVDGDGGVWEGRDPARLGTHVGSTPDGLNNEGNIGICGLGTYVHQYPPRKMVSACAELCDLLAEYYGRRLTVRGHKDWLDIHHFHPVGGVDCPGRLESAVRQASLLIAKRYPDREPPRRLARR